MPVLNIKFEINLDRNYCYQYCWVPRVDFESSWSFNKWLCRNNTSLCRCKLGSIISGDITKVSIEEVSLYRKAFHEKRHCQLEIFLKKCSTFQVTITTLNMTNSLLPQPFCKIILKIRLNFQETFQCLKWSWWPGIWNFTKYGFSNEPANFSESSEQLC